MNTIAIKHTVVTLLMTALFMSLVPLTAHAQPAGGERGGDFCENLDSNLETALSRLEAKKASTDKSDKYDTKKAERLLQLETRRAEADANREARYEKLRDRAETDEQSDAVEEFADTIESLVETRRSTIDAAIADFEETVEALMEERTEAIDGAADDIEDEVRAIFETAEAACDDEDDVAEIRQAFVADLKALREDQKGKRGQYSFREELAAARADLKAAVDAARADYREAAAEAKETLRAAFGG